MQLLKIFCFCINYTLKCMNFVCVMCMFVCVSVCVCVCECVMCLCGRFGLQALWLLMFDCQESLIITWIILKQTFMITVRALQTILGCISTTFCQQQNLNKSGSFQVKILLFWCRESCREGRGYKISPQSLKITFSFRWFHNLEDCLWILIG